MTETSKTKVKIAIENYKKERKIEYVIQDMETAKKDGWPSASRYDDHRCGIWMMEDGKPIKLIGIDGGEPEDQILYRDWHWVANALEEAYKMGFDDGSAA